MWYNHRSPYEVTFMACRLLKIKIKRFNWKILLTETSEVFGDILTGVLWLESGFGVLKIIPNWMLLRNSLSSGISVRFRIQIFTDQTNDMPCVTWHLLITYIVIWSAHPIFCKTAAIAEYLFVFVYFGHKPIGVKSLCFIVGRSSISKVTWLSKILKYLSLDLSSRWPKPLGSSGHMPSIAREVVLLVVRCSCKRSHIF